MSSAGPLSLVGGSEWQTGCDFDADLLAASSSANVLVIAAAAAYEWPDRAIGRAEAWFKELGGTVEGSPVLTRRDAENPEYAAQVREAAFIYFADGSPMHLRSVLKDTLVWRAVVDAHENGAVLAGSSAGATVLGDPMVDPRGGAFTLGLNLLTRMSVIPHWDNWTPDKARRMTQLMPRDVVVAEIPERTALTRWADGRWEMKGAGEVLLTLNREPITTDQLSELTLA